MKKKIHKWWAIKDKKGNVLSGTISPIKAECFFGVPEHIDCSCWTNKANEKRLNKAVYYVCRVQIKEIK